MPFSLSPSSDPVSGLMDEVFFINHALSDHVIFRIWACGVDGKRCTCEADAPAEYATCGRAEPSCDKLIAYNAGLPL